MSKRMKIIISVVTAVLLLAIGATAVVAQEEPPTTQEVGGKGLPARVAEILCISETDLVNAFKQACQEMRDESFDQALDKAVENGSITEEEANEIREWWEQRPETVDRGLLPHAWGWQLGGRWHKNYQGGCGACPGARLFGPAQ